MHGLVVRRLSLTVTPARVAPGGSVTWTLTYKNNSSTQTLNGYTITDDIPSGVTVMATAGRLSRMAPVEP